MGEYKVEEHLNLVAFMCKKYNKRKDVDFDDLFQEATIGLMKACESYQEGKGTKFTTYACQQIRFAIIDYLKTVDLIRIPENTISTANRIYKMDYEKYTVKELCNLLQKPEIEIKNSLDHLKRNYTSIDSNKKFANGKNEKVSFHELLAADEKYDENLMFIFFLGKKGKIKNNDYKIIKMTYLGMNNTQISEALNLHEKYVINRRALVRKKFKEDKEIIGEFSY